MWTCPDCKSVFKNKNQSHSCGTFSIETVFEKYPLKTYALFERLLEEVVKFGEMNIRPVKNGVMFSVKTTFLALKPHSSYLAVEFSGEKKIDEFPIEKCVAISKTEFAHFLRIQELDEIDQQLINWLKEAYCYNYVKK